MSHLYKTKLCALYQRGNCRRQSCSFAHGQEELRAAPYGRHRDDSRDRDRLDYRRFSPRRRRSPFRDGSRDGDTMRRSSHDRDFRSSSRSPVRSSSSPRSSGFKRGGANNDSDRDGKKARTENGDRLRADAPPGEPTSLSEQLHMAEADLEALNQRKSQLDTDLQAASQELQKMLATIKELEVELSDAQAENRRSVSKIKRVARAYRRCLRCEEDARRARAKFEKLAEEELRVRGDDSDGNNLTSEGEHEKGNNDFLHNSVESQGQHAAKKSTPMDHRSLVNGPAEANHEQT